MALGKRSYPGGFRCQLISIGVLLALASLFHAFTSSYVQQNQVYTQDAAQGSAFTALAASNVPFYNAGGFPVISGSTTELYSFDWFVFATDSLRPFLMVYTLVAVVLAVLVPLDTLTALLYQPIVVIILLVELAKVVYFLIILLGLFGFSCSAYAFCRNRNPAITATPDFSFILSLISAGVFAVVAIALTSLPGTVRRAHLSSDPIGARISGKRSPAQSDFEMDEFDQSALSYRTAAAKPRRSKRTKARAGAESGLALIPEFPQQGV